MRVENPELQVVPDSRNVWLVWVSDEVCRSAEIARLGNVPKVVSYTVACERGIPVDGHELPTEAAIMGAISALGDDGVRHLAYLMGARIHGEGTLASISEDRIRAGLRNFQRDLSRRPNPRRPELVELARKLLDSGVRTTDVVKALCKRGVSSATAYRYVRKAGSPECYRAPSE